MLRYMKTESKSTIEIQCENPHISTSIIFLMTKDSCQIPGAFITFCLPLQIFVPNPSHLPFSRCSIFQGFFHFLSKATILTCKIEMHYATYMHICVAICIQMYVIMVLLQWFTFSINFSLTAVRISADSSIAWSSKSKVARLGLGLHTQHVLLMKQNLHLYAYSWCLFCCLLGDFL